MMVFLWGFLSGVLVGWLLMKQPAWLGWFFAWLWAQICAGFEKLRVKIFG